MMTDEDLARLFWQHFYALSPFQENRPHEDVTVPLFVEFLAKARPACVLCGSTKELATRCSSCDHHMIATEGPGEAGMDAWSAGYADGQADAEEDASILRLRLDALRKAVLGIATSPECGWKVYTGMAAVALEDDLKRSALSERADSGEKT